MNVFSGQKYNEKAETSFMFAFNFRLSLLTAVFKNLEINIFDHDTIIVHIVYKKGIFSRKIARENRYTLILNVLTK